MTGVTIDAVFANATRAPFIDGRLHRLVGVMHETSALAEDRKVELMTARAKRGRSEFRVDDRRVR